MRLVVYEWSPPQHKYLTRGARIVIKHLSLTPAVVWAELLLALLPLGPGALAACYDTRPPRFRFTILQQLQQIYISM